jgi:hypothetical protein
MTDSASDDLGHKLRNVVDSATKEADVLQFLERHPQIIGTHHHVMGGAIFPEFPLGRDFRPDFAFIEQISVGTYLYMIEIEDPNQLLFISNDEFSQPFNHAMTQITDWAGWVGRHQQELNELFEALEEEHGFSPSGFLQPHCTLIMGRRAKLSNKRRKDRLQSRVAQMARNLEFRTYDGFIEAMPLVLREDTDNRRCLVNMRYSGGRWRQGDKT